MKKIIFINRFYSPDHSATSQLLTDLSEYLVCEGLDIHVVSSRQLYEDASARLNSYEIINGVKVNRIYSTQFGRDKLVGRSIDYLSFYISVLFFLILNTNRHDIIVAKTDPPLVSVIAGIVVKAKGAKLVNWIQDLFPEVVNSLSVSTMPKPLLFILKAMRNWSLRIADQNVVIGEIMRQKVLDSNKIELRCTVIKNWNVGLEDEPILSEIDFLKEEWGLSDKFVVGYSGNLGRAHEYEIFFNVAEKFNSVEDVKFLFVGGGVGMALLTEMASDRGISNVIFKPYQPLSKLNLTLRMADVHMISLVSELEGLIVPSKFYGILAASRPVIFIGSAQGELALEINEYEIGATVKSGDAHALYNTILDFKSKKINCPSSRIKKIYQLNYLPKNSFEHWKKVLD